MTTNRRSLRDKTLSLDALRTIVGETVGAGFAGGSIRKVIDRMSAQAARGDDLAVDFIVYDGDARIAGDLIVETDEEHKDLLRARLPREALALEGDADEPDGEWWIDYVKSEALLKRLRAGTPLVAG